MSARGIVFAFLMFAGICSSCSFAEPPPPVVREETPEPLPRPPLDGVVDADHLLAVGILRGADRVEPMRLVPVLEGDDVARLADPAQAGGFLDGFPIRTKATELGEPFADKLELFLLNDRNFSAPAEGDAERCTFEPEIAFRAYEGAEWTAVVIDFDCNLMTATSSQGQLVLPSISFAPGRQEMLELVKEAFPDEPDIQQLR